MLDERFKMVDEFGVYWAHQPVYGFRERHSEAGRFDQYIRTYEIMKSLSHLDFKTLLDVGGAEGWKAFLAKELFSAEVANSDLSEEACKRSAELFGIRSVPGDVHELPFNSNEFDVVISSETLEHAKDVNEAVRELLRVARRAVVITVPHETKEEVEKHITEGEVHGHIHAFDLKSFDFLKSEGYEVLCKKVMTRYSAALALRLIDKELTRRKVDAAMPFRAVLSYFFNACVPVANRILLDKRTTALIMKLNSLISPFTASYYNILFMILKDKECFIPKETRTVSACDILNLKCPLHYLEIKETNRPT